ncbi:hypothetical protein C1141_21990, partial [Vibrio agarivorans]
NKSYSVSQNKIFGINIFANVVLAKLPKVMEGEVLRYGCGRDEWRLPAVLYMLLEDKCVYTPSFDRNSFSITASTTFGEQDKHNYFISIFHKPTDTTIFLQSIYKKQEVVIYRSSLEAF